MDEIERLCYLLPLRIAAPLARHGIVTLADLREHSRLVIGHAVPGVGRVGIEACEALMAKYSA
jgi:hypothetical protein